MWFTKDVYGKWQKFKTKKEGIKFFEEVKYRYYCSKLLTEEEFKVKVMEAVDYEVYCTEHQIKEAERLIRSAKSELQDGEERLKDAKERHSKNLAAKKAAEEDALKVLGG